MRTTLTLDDDVAAVIERTRKVKGQSLKDVINEALREGLKHTSGPARKHVPFHTHPVDLGACLLGDVDNIADVLAVSEGESFK